MTSRQKYTRMRKQINIYSHPSISQASSGKGGKINLPNRELLIRSFITAVRRIFLFSPLATNDRLRDFFILTPLKWITSEGIHGLKEWKSLMNYAVRKLLESESPNPRPTRRVPPCLQSLIRRAKGTGRETLWAVTLCNSYRIIRWEPDCDVSTITDPSTVDPNWLVSRETNLLNGIREFISLNGLKAPKGMNTFKWVVSHKGGPNGKPAWKCYERDAQAILQSDLGPVMGQFMELVGLNADRVWWGMSKVSGGSNRIRKDLVVPWYHQLSFYLGLIDKIPATTEMVRKPDHLHSRLAFLSDKGGKTRAIAMGEVYTQTLLKPFHELIFHYLKQVADDGTHDQDSVREVVRSWSSKGIPLYSLDMSACTDRMPVSFQAYVLSRTIFDTSQTLGWWRIISKRDFYFKSGKTWFKTRYSVGQPMGFYSSWAAMALTHHVIVYWAASLAGKVAYNKYVILGDDIVIADPVIADWYMKIISSLGISISMTKSFTEVGLAEFGKGYYKNGVDLKPLSPELFLWKDRRSVSNVVELAVILSRKGYWSGTLTRFKKTFTRLPVQLFITLCIMRECTGTLGILSFGFPRVSWDVFSQVYSFNNSLHGFVPKRMSLIISLSKEPSSTMPSPAQELLDRVTRISHEILFENQGDYLIETQILLGEGWVAWDPHYWDSVVGVKYLTGPNPSPPIFRSVELFDPLPISDMGETLKLRKVKNFLKARPFRFLRLPYGRILVIWEGAAKAE